MVVRRRTEDGQGLLVPHHTVILVSRGDLPLGELVLRHRGKQGPALAGRLDNAFGEVNNGQRVACERRAAGRSLCGSW